MELIAPFVAPSEASTVAFSMVRVDLAIGQVIADQPLPRVHARQEPGLATGQHPCPGMILQSQHQEQEGDDGDQGRQGRLRT